MLRFLGLLRDTWWLWIVLFTMGTGMTLFMSWIFVVTFPICLFSFVYFGLMRYDELGNEKKR